MVLCVPLPLCFIVIGLSANAAIVVFVMAFPSLLNRRVVGILSGLPVFALFSGLMGFPGIRAAEKWMFDSVGIARSLRRVPIRNKRNSNECGSDILDSIGCPLASQIIY